MNWNIIASWAFGFFCLPVTASIVVAGFGGIGLLWSAPEHFHLRLGDMWCGGGLLVVLAIVAGVALYKFFP